MDRQEFLDKTRGGWDVLRQVFPQLCPPLGKSVYNAQNPFFEQQRTGSFYIVQKPDGVYICGDNNPKYGMRGWNCFELVAHLKNFSPRADFNRVVNACLEIAGGSYTPPVALQNAKGGEVKRASQLGREAQRLPEVGDRWSDRDGASWEVQAVYVYEGENPEDAPPFYNVRHWSETTQAKRFTPISRDAQGVLRYGGVPPIPFNLPELLDAAKQCLPYRILVEGEKDCLQLIGELACEGFTIGGVSCHKAAQTVWEERWNGYLVNADGTPPTVVIVEDNDALGKGGNAGRTYAERAEAAIGTLFPVLRLTLSKYVDVSDFIRARKNFLYSI